MPLLTDSGYKVTAPWLRSGHFQTVWPTLFRRVAPPSYERERIEAPDGDFFDVDWVKRPARKLLVILHGLEGSAQSIYVQGMANVASQRGFCVAALNFRGCSGEPNRKAAWYNSGYTEDLHTFVKLIGSGADFDEVALLGFSVGGNIVLKFLAEIGGAMPLVKSAVAISVPIDLRECSERLNRTANALYLKRFMKMLCGKVREKMKRYPGLVQDLGLHRLRTFREFDDLYTAPLHGFRDAEDYWAHSSSKPLLLKVATRTLILTAKNDPFLTKACYPVHEARDSKYLHLETPPCGGHVGFMSDGGGYWSERRALEFIEDGKTGHGR